MPGIKVGGDVENGSYTNPFGVKPAISASPFDTRTIFPVRRKRASPRRFVADTHRLRRCQKLSACSYYRYEPIDCQRSIGTRKYAQPEIIGYINLGKRRTILLSIKSLNNKQINKIYSAKGNLRTKQECQLENNTRQKIRI